MLHGGISWGLPMGLPDVLQDPFTAQFLAIATAVLALVVWHFFAQRPPQVQSSAPSGNPVAPSSCSRNPATEPARVAPLGAEALSKASHGVFSSFPTLSICCNALFLESDSEVLTNGITLLSDTVKVLREASNISKVYLIFQDSSRDGMLGVILNSALEAEGLLGSGAGQVPKHRLVLCSSQVGKIAIVRQLETSLHVEVDPHVHKELARFKTSQWLVGRPNTQEGLVPLVKRKSGM